MDYTSQAEFYKDINNSIKNRKVKVITDDSSFVSYAGSEIKYDSLQVVSKILLEIPINEIKDITNVKYYGIPDEGPSAVIRLKSGRELRVEDLKILPDSTARFKNIVIKSISINKVKNISYRIRWQSTLAGIPAGFLCGTLIGGISGATGIFPHISTGGNEPLIFDPGTSGIVGAFWGAIIGTFTGAIILFLVLSSGYIQ